MFAAGLQVVGALDLYRGGEKEFIATTLLRRCYSRDEMSELARLFPSVLDERWRPAAVASDFCILLAQVRGSMVAN